MASSSAKRCHYEVLGLPRDCTPDEIRSAYRRLALQRHPDKLVQTGISQSEATAQFQELQQAYEVLSDPKERSFYDSHRSQILFADPNSSSNSLVPDLFSFFSNSVFSGYSDSGKGFYKVYSGVFDKIHANEVNFAKKMGLPVPQAPLMGNLDSPYAQVTAFYGYWMGFSSVMDFCWADEYDVMAGPNRRSRRLMEEENNKVRRKAKKEYNETVRRLADFAKKRDKRVIDMKVKKVAEMEKKKEEEREKKKRLEKEKKERAMAYEEPEWAKVEEGEEASWFEEVEEEEEKKDENEFYCVLCGKKFKSEKQWKNHEQSKKHKEKVAEFKDSLADEEDLEAEVEGEEEDVGAENGRPESEEGGIEVNDDQLEEVDDLEERIRDGLNVAEEETRNEVKLNDDGDGNDDDDDDFDATHSKESEKADVSVDFDDDENGFLEAMVAGRKSKKPGASTQKPKASVTPSQTENENENVDENENENKNENDGVGFMEYNNQKSTRKKRRAKKEKGRVDEPHGAAFSANYENRNSDGNNNSFAEESSSQYSVENEENGKENEQVGRDKKSSNQPVDKKGTSKDAKTRAKTSSKGRKAKASKNLDNICEACGEEFESRNKLHKHLGDSGHASIKGR
ncbi:DNAJ protein JJJ1 homolog [Lotus japonicus]|uniref:DNAJ protein JJJ1 homolog n=1 Tax=Lotus japonicus TaxID=34305 RepID=UPI0025854327|nr:DNAJ protein JJJ1 homolog [Lotus japonicus]